VDVFLQGAGALGGNATAGGGTGGLRWWAWPNLGLRLAGGARIGVVSKADATTTTLFAAAGPGYRVRLGAFEVGARTDFVVLRHDVTRDHPATTTRGRWLGAIDLVAEAGIAISDHVGLLLGVGPEFALGPTEIAVGGAHVGDIPAVRGIAEFGLRIRF
jgi:hypothetical protein